MLVTNIILLISIMFIFHVCYPCAFDESTITNLTDPKPIFLCTRPGISTMFYVEQYRTPILDHINICLQLNILLKNFILKVIIDSEEIGKIVQKSHENFPCKHTAE